MTDDRFTRREAAQAARVSLLSARKLYRALGYAEPDEQRALAEPDLAVLRLATGLVRSGHLDETTVLNLMRAVGRSLDRLATWQVETVAEHVAGDREQAVRLLGEVTPDLQELLGHVWRHQLEDAVDRVLTPPGESFERAVGFADVVGWTKVVQSLDEPALAVLVRRFGDVASDAVAYNGGRIIKTVGDEVMFSARTAAEAARISVELSSVFLDDAVVPGVRVGFVHGPAVARLGDLFGTTVNLAARVSRLADVGDVFTDARTAATLTDEAGLYLRTLGRRQVRGFGSIPLVSVQSSGGAGRPAYAPGEHG